MKNAAQNSTPSADSPANPAVSAAGQLKPSAKMPGETIRALISLWLLFHFFGICLAIATVRTGEPSVLLSRAKQAPLLQQYLFALWLDVGYSYRLTYGEWFDADHTIEVSYAGRPEGDKLVLPPPDAQGERLERYQALTRRAANAVYMGGDDSQMAGGLGEAILQRNGAKELNFIVRRHTPLSMEDMAGSDPAQRDPFNRRTYGNVYSGTVAIVNGRVNVQKEAESRTDVAPVVNPGQNSSGGSDRPNAGARAEAPPLPQPKTDSGKSRFQLPSSLNLPKTPEPTK